MIRIAHSEKDTGNAVLGQHLWAADQFRANFGVESQAYTAPRQF